MATLRIAPAAKRDLELILSWTHENFGERIRRSYESLIVQALSDIADNPDRTGSQRRKDISSVARTYHLYFSRSNSRSRQLLIRQPRHFLLFRAVDDGLVEVARILHDSMDLQRHLPAEYRDKPEG
ncbi:MAG: type II toxin-antitoxin system RelE/ParE family toxin [Pirellulales bacterium]|nr:type II toxin-antitoxin system RelE/ParE family toxin [Pirellulales bacterium]